MARILIETYGCTLNKADSTVMESVLTSRGHTVVHGKASGTGAYDVVVVNTCTVKDSAERKILNRLDRLGKAGQRLVVAGCLASANSDLVARAVPAASIVGTSNAHRIAEVVEACESGTRMVIQERTTTDKLSFFSQPGGVIAAVPISEGCLSNCSFCETKFARGPLNSFSEELVVKAVEMCVKKGAKEIELASQDTGAYGADRHTNIARLLGRLFEIDGDFKIRVGMINPEHLPRFADELICALGSQRVYKFLHLPVQSGSDAVLKSMNRRYSMDEIRGLVKELRSKLPGITLATDFIVGYPTETREDFELTMNAIHDLRFNIVNVSKFGARPHARARGMKRVSGEELKRRSIDASRLYRGIQKELRDAMVGSTRRVLLTESNKRSFTGRDDYYNQIALDGNGLKLGEFINARITGTSMGCSLAEVC